jgi:1,4-alpha-glucan branching enzyme
MERSRPALLDDPYLAPYAEAIGARRDHMRRVERRLTGGRATLADFASGHTFFGLHRDARGWVFREWAPNATAIALVGDFSGWRPRADYALRRLNREGHWELRLPAGALRHGDHYRLHLAWPDGAGDRIPSYARRVVQDPETKIFSAQVWAPERPYAWQHDARRLAPAAPLVYEAHVGMAQEEGCIGTYDAFRANVLPRIVRAGYNTIQLMAVMEHPYYASFGYHVASFFAASSRFGTPEALKGLVDAAHGEGLAVIIDLVHSHAVRNEVEGLSRFDGTPYQFFHAGERGLHTAWDSRCFDYGKPEVLHFLLSNCRYWLDEFRVDGFRFDGVTSMLYTHHGMGPGFASYDSYFDDAVDPDALAYLALANKLIHAVRPGALTVAEDVSGMPGLAAPPEEGGCGFDYRLAMGVPDCWFKLLTEFRDEDWPIDWLWHELTNRRAEERTISYVESHDQAIVGSKTAIFQLCDAAMYTHMGADDPDATVERGVALHKMMRLATLFTAGGGYLNFMGNEFGHPEWIDFPREGNNWSYHYARRQWSLVDSTDLKYRFLAEFDRVMIELAGRAALFALPVECLERHDDDKLFALRRGDIVALFNFHPSRSLADRAVPGVGHGCVHAFDSDEPRFGGQGRIEAGQVYPGGPSGIRVYLPARTALVLRSA